MPLFQLCAGLRERLPPLQVMVKTADGRYEEREDLEDKAKKFYLGERGLIPLFTDRERCTWERRATQKNVLTSENYVDKICNHCVVVVAVVVVAPAAVSVVAGGGNGGCTVLLLMMMMLL